MSKERPGAKRVGIREPLSKRPASTYECMVAEGRITPATRDLPDVKPLPPLKGKQLSDVLYEMRDDGESPV
jgi:hypothetical protein